VDVGDEKPPLLPPLLLLPLLLELLMGLRGARKDLGLAAVGVCTARGTQPCWLLQLLLLLLLFGFGCSCPVCRMVLEEVAVSGRGRRLTGLDCNGSLNGLLLERCCCCCVAFSIPADVLEV